MTAANDEVAQPLYLRSLAYNGTSLTIGQRLTIVDPTSDSILADHYIEGTTENVELNFEARWVGGIKITAMPASGGAVTAELG